MKASVLLSKNSVRKKQKDYQIRQASDSVSLYHEIVKERSSDTRPATDRKNTSVGKPEISPRNDTNVFTAPPEKCSNSVQAGPAEYSRSSKRVIRDSTPRAESPPAKMSRNTCQEADRKPSGFYDKTVCKKMQESDQPVKIGTSWRSVFSGLRDEIMVRQYSPKTLKSYSMWPRKFQAFTKSKSLESINDENYKAFLTFLAVEKRLEVRLILILKTPGSFRLRIPNPDEPEP